MKILALTCCCVDVFPELGTICPGGNALNLAISCKQTGLADVHLMGNIGNDGYGEKIKHVIDTNGIIRERLYEVEGSSATNVIYISPEGERYFKADSWQGGVYENFRLSRADKVYLQGMDAVATTYYDPNFTSLLEQREQGTFIMAVDFHNEALKKEWESYFSNIDLFFISGKEEQFKQLMDWSKQFDTIFVATLGAAGSIAFSKGKSYQVPAISVNEVVDTTGCGDAYQGAFIASFITYHQIKVAMEAGSLAAANVLSHMGGVSVN